jgi:uncharacterized protein YjbJ (UPF0337 family)
MKPSIKNEITGKVHELKGKIKERAGHRMNDRDLQGQGIAEKMAGKVQNRVGPAEKAPGN